MEEGAGITERPAELTSSFILRFFLPPDLSSKGVTLPSRLRSSTSPKFVDRRAGLVRLTCSPEDVASNASYRALRVSYSARVT